MNVVYNVDCMEYMRSLPDKALDLAVVDPPYFSGPERRGYYGTKVSSIGVHRDYPISPKWDVPQAPYFEELDRVAKKYIVWGCNYFDYHFPAWHNTRMDVDNHAAIEKMTVDALKGWLLRDDDRRHYREKHSFFHDENYMRVVISDE